MNLGFPEPDAHDLLQKTTADIRIWIKFPQKDSPDEFLQMWVCGFFARYFAKIKKINALIQFEGKSILIDLNNGKSG